MAGPNARHTERAIISSLSVRMMRTVPRFPPVEITPSSRHVFIHSSIQTCPPAWHRRGWTETFADSGRRKNRTSRHHVQRGAPSLHPICLITQKNAKRCQSCGIRPQFSAQQTGCQSHFGNPINQKVGGCEMLCADREVMEKLNQMGGDKISWVFLQFSLGKPANQIAE